MPKLKGELQNSVAGVSVGHPPPSFPLQVFTLGQVKDPEDQCFFHFSERPWSLEPAWVMGLWGA